jgi:hypothetical protein
MYDVRDVARTLNLIAVDTGLGLRQEDRRKAVCDLSVNPLDDQRLGLWVTVWKRECHKVTEGKSFIST